MSKKKPVKNKYEIPEDYTIVDILSGQSKLFTDTGKPLYMDDNFYTNAYYDYTSRVSQGLKKGSICMMPNCTNKPIRYSHTIPESILRNISDNTGHLYYPRHIRSTNNYEIDSIGVAHASTFSGFCSTHEQKFTFEKEGNVHDESIGLQNYRVLCRDLFFWQNVKARHEFMLKKYNQELLEYHRTLLNNINHSGEITYVADENSQNMTKNIETADAEITHIRNNFYDAYFNCIVNDDDTISTMVLEMPYKLPIALAGRSNFACKDDSGVISIFTVVLSVFPSDSSTHLIFSYKSEDKNNFAGIIKDYDAFTILSFIESWMIYGTDYWYISPDYWNNLESGLKNRILNDLLITEYTPSKELNYSIFSKIREVKINEYEDELKTNKNPEIRKHIKAVLTKEKKKLENSITLQT